MRIVLSSVIFMGSASFAVPSLSWLIREGVPISLVVTRPDKPKGRGLELCRTPVKDVALAAGLACFEPRTLRDPAVHARLSDARPDLIVVAAYGRILPPEVLAIPRLGCINVHGSLLPELRGAAPVHWAIIRGATRTGVSIMAMDEGCDTGPVYSRLEEPIRPDDTAGTLYDRLAARGAELLAATLPAVVAGTIRAEPQDSSKATLAPILTKEHGVVDWNRPAREIADRVRGVEPWPGACTFTPGGIRLRVFPFLDVLPAMPGERPGQVVALDGDGMLVATSDGCVRIRTVQPAGGRKMTPKELAAGRRIGVGETLLSVAPNAGA